MADFQQNVVPTFTRLVDEDLGRMEKNILRAARRTPIGVIIHLRYQFAKGFYVRYSDRLHGRVASLPKSERRLRHPTSASDVAELTIPSLGATPSGGLRLWLDRFLS